jgi:hypothetical protein
MPPLEMLFPYRISLHISEAEGAEGAAEEAPQDFDPVPADQTKEIEQAHEKLDSLPPGAATTAASSGSDLSGGIEGVTSPVSFKVDDFTGAGHASYSIAVPPGRDGLQPKIELFYTSSGGNSWLGVGWDLTLGYIQRRGYRKGVPKYDDTDVFELQLPGSGPQELVKVASGAYAGEYRLKVEGSLLRIKYISNSNSWEVTDKSGVKMLFGQSSASRIGPNPGSQNIHHIFRWCLDQVKDPKTNYLEVSYQKPSDSPGAIYLSAIHYNGQVSGGLSHNHHVYFNLESEGRPDPIYNYRGGFKQLIMRRLSSIDVKTNQVQGEALVRRYQFSYVQNSQDIHSAPQPRSRLAEIKLYGSDYGSPNPLDLPAVKFTYQTPPADLGFEGEPISWRNPSVWGATKGNLIQNWGLGGGGTYTDVIDMDGDGRVDRVVYDRWTSQYQTWGVYLNDGESFKALPGGENQPNWSNPSAWDDKKGNYIRNTYMDSENRNLGTFTDVIDMNGDGLPDRVVYNKNCQTQYPNCPWTVYWNNGQGFTDQTTPNWPNPSVWDSADNKGNYIRSNRWVGTYNYGTMTEVIDMNGDGLPDRVVYDKDYVYQAGRPANWKVYWNIYRDNPAQTGFSQTPQTWLNYSPWVNNNHGNTIRSVRTDGSGTIADLIDMNGDGLPDRVVYDYNYKYSANNFQPAMWRVYFNTGKGFEQTPVLWPNPSPWGNANGNNIRDTGIYGIQTDVVDVNGDGLPDRVYFEKNCKQQPDDTWDCPWTVYRNKGPVTDLLSKIENGLGGTIEITYQPSTAYVDDLGEKANHIPLVVQTVHTYTVKDGRQEGSEGKYEQRYHYANAAYDSVKADFLGFGKVMTYQMRDQQWESKTETEFHQTVEGVADEYRKGKPIRQTVTSYEGHTRETAYSWNPGYATLGGGKFPALDSVTTTVTDVGPGGPWTYSQTTRDVYDVKPNDLEHQTLNLLEEHKNELCPTCESEDEVQTVMEYGGLNWGSWILDKPTVVTVTKYVKKEPPEQDVPHEVRSRKWMDYNADGNLINLRVPSSQPLR